MCFVQTLAALTEAGLYLKMNIRKNTEDTNKGVKKIIKVYFLQTTISA